MNCPRCESGQLDERDRDGVTIDVCTRCRGLWLDRGELEKLIARTNADFDDSERHRSREYQEDRGRQYRDYDDYRRKHPRKKSLLESLGDIFD